jgi:aminoglycoside phosphotransferase (APT) family kinase protein
VHRLWLETRSGVVREVVLRRYVLDWVQDEPWAPGNEALALRLLEPEATVPAPRLLAADLDGEATGTPTILMSALPGRVEWQPDDMETWLRRLAEALPTIHALPVSAELSEWAPYAPTPPGTPPEWSQHPEAWETAFALYAGPQPAADRVFLHRDYHPGNVLWTDHRITGIVDWVSACAGPPEEDVAHCRANLALHHGQEQAERFLRLWRSVAGRQDYDPYFDLTGVVSFSLTEPDPGLDAFVAAAAARLR